MSILTTVLYSSLAGSIDGNHASQIISKLGVLTNLMTATYDNEYL
jgi:hypothetical protein